MSPNIGEYWYCKRLSLFTVKLKDGEVSTSTYNVHLCKIIATGVELIVKSDFDTYFTCKSEDLLSKWEPNLFWKILGYK